MARAIARCRRGCATLAYGPRCAGCFGASPDARARPAGAWPVGSPRGPRSHDGTILPDTIDTMWGTDLTTTFTGEGPAAVFIAVDHCSAECVGIHAHARATRFEALEPIRQGVRRYFGGFAANVAHGLAVRHDHGSQYMSDHFQREIAFLGIESSPAFVRAPEGNGCAERFIRTLKEPVVGSALPNDRGTAAGTARI